jgi:hypothetical protein
MIRKKPCIEETTFFPSVVISRHSLLGLLTLSHMQATNLFATPRKCRVTLKLSAYSLTVTESATKHSYCIMEKFCVELDSPRLDTSSS